MKKIILLSFVFFFIQKILSQQFETDRSSNSCTPITIGKNSTLAELGFSRSVIGGYSKPYKDVLLMAPMLDLKYGINKNLDLQLGFDYHNIKEIVSNGTFITKNIPFFLFGFKLNLIKQKSVIPTVSLMGQLINKTKFHFHFGFDTLFDYKLRLLFRNKITDVLAINYSLGVERLSDFNSNLRYAFSLTPNFTFNENWNMFIDLHGFYIIKDIDKNPIFYVGSGVKYKINNKFQIDINGGLRFGHKEFIYKAGDMYYGSGLSYKFN